MSQYIDGPTRSFVPGAALAQHTRVTLSSGKLAAADGSTLELGTLTRPTYGDGDPESVAVLLRTASGTTKMIASGAISAGADVYAAASGKIAATGTVKLGTALEAAAADGDIIEVLRL